MKRPLLYLAALLAALTLRPAVARPQPVFILVSQAAVQQHLADPAEFAAAGLIPVVVLSGNGSNCYQPGWDPEPLLADLDARIDGPFWVGLWCDNQARDEQPGGSTLVPWGDDAGWAVLLENLGRLRVSCEAHGVPGVFWDGEIYTATPGNNGGGMNSTAWAGSAKAARARGQQVRAALGSLQMGQYVYVYDATRRTGWTGFWSGAYRKGDFLLDEGGYLRFPGWRPLAERSWGGSLGVINVRGRAIRPGETVVSLRRRLPAGRVWLYPVAGWASWQALAPAWQ